MIKVGSRDSRLAVVQAEEVMRRLGECELVTMKTTGDKILDRTLDKVGGKGRERRARAAGERQLGQGKADRLLVCAAARAAGTAVSRYRGKTGARKRADPASQA